MSSSRQIAYLKTIGLLLAGLYLFILALTGFKESLGLLFKNPETINTVLSWTTGRPLSCLMAGILLTALVQSSSAAIGIIVSAVSTGIIDPSNSVFFILGANIGTSITSSIVGLLYLKPNQDRFENLAAASILDDVFKVLNVSLFFLLEITTGILGKASSLLVSKIQSLSASTFLLEKFPDILDQTTKPIIKVFFAHYPESFPQALISFVFVGVLIWALQLISKSMKEMIRTRALSKNQLFNNSASAFFGGLGLCWLLQSSSVTISFVIPLVTENLLSLRYAYHYALGAALATTIDASQIISYFRFGAIGLQVGLTHFIVNAIGVTLFSLPILRDVPLRIARKIGATLSQSQHGRLYLLFYVFGLFVALPLSVIFIFKI